MLFLGRDVQGPIEETVLYITRNLIVFLDKYPWS